MSIFDLSPEEFTALSVLVGYALLPGLTTNQQNALGNFLMGVGQTLESVAAQQEVLNNNCPSQTQQLQCRLKELEKRLAQLEKKLTDS